MLQNLTDQLIIFLTITVMNLGFKESQLLKQNFNINLTFTSCHFNQFQTKFSLITLLKITEN